MALESKLDLVWCPGGGCSTLDAVPITRRSASSATCACGASADAEADAALANGDDGGSTSAGGRSDIGDEGTDPSLAIAGVDGFKMLRSVPSTPRDDMERDGDVTPSSNPCPEDPTLRVAERDARCSQRFRAICICFGQVKITWEAEAAILVREGSKDNC